MINHDFNILVVENDERLNKLLIEEIEKEGFQVSGVKTAGDAVDWIINNRNSLLLIDYSLPDMNAEELISILKSKKLDFEFIIIIACENEQIAVDMMKKGARDYIIKNQNEISIVNTIITRVVNEINSEKRLLIVENIMENNERKYQLIFETVANLILIINNNEIITDCNSKIYSFLGYKKEEVLNNSIYKIVLEECMEDLKKITRECRDYEHSYNNELKMKTKNGNILDVNLNASCFSVNKSETNCILIANDITEQKIIKQELNEAKERYKKIINFTPQVLIGFDVNGYVESCSKTIRKVTGYRNKDMIGRHFSEFSFFKKKDDEIFRNSFNSLIDGKKLKSFEIAWIHKNQSIHFSELYMSSIKQDNKIIGVQVISQDITDKKLYEERISEHSKNIELLYKISLELVNYNSRKNIFDLISKKLKIFVEKSVVLTFSFDLAHKRMKIESIKYSRKIDNKIIEAIKVKFNHSNLYINDNLLFELENNKLIQLKNEELNEYYSELFNYPGKDKIDLFDVYTIGLKFKKQLHGSVLILVDKGEIIHNKKIIETFIQLASIVLQRYNAESDLRKKERRFKEFFNNITSNAAIFEAINDGKDFVMKTFNHENQIRETKDKNLLQFSSGLNKFNILKAFKKVYRSGNPLRNENYLYNDTGIKYWYDNYIFRLPSKEIVIIQNDITKIKKAEYEIQKRDKFNQIRIEIGNLVLDKSFSEQEIISRMLEVIGVKMDYCTTTFFAFDEFEENFIATYVWYKNEIPSTMGLRFSFDSMKKLNTEDYIILPDDIQSNDRKIFDAILKRYGFETSLLIKYKKTDILNGIFAFFSNNEEKLWSEYEKQILSDIVHLLEIRTQQIIAEKELIESEIRYRELFNNMKSGVIVYEPINNGSDFIIKDLNKASEAMTNTLRENAVGGSVEIVFPGLKDFGLFNVIKLVNETGKPSFHPVSMYKDDKITMWAENYVYKLPTNEIVTVYDDVTVKKQAELNLVESEKRLLNIINNMPVMMIAFNEDAEIISWNRECEEVTGYKAEEVIIRSDIEEILYDDKKSKDFFRNIFEKRDFYFRNAEVNIRCKNGIVKNISFSNISDRFPIEGWHTWFVGVDISDRKRFENELFNSKEKLKLLNESLEDRVKKRTLELEEANKNLESFAYSISHDLRAPLRHINGFTQLLLNEIEDIIPEKSKQYFENIIEATNNMSDLINDLLKYSRTGRAVLNYSRFDLNDLINNAKYILQNETKDRNIKWIIKDLPIIDGDYTLLKQVIINLISNAIKYSKDIKETVIEIGSFSKNDEFVIYIKDNGVGFSMDYSDKLFGVFQRLHSSEEFEGTGIGLAIVKSIITKHGGRVWAEGTEMQGAVFYFSLPEKNKKK